MKVSYWVKDRNKGIGEIKVDGEPWREVSVSIFGKRPEIPECQSLEDLEKELQNLERKGALKYAIWRLSSKNYLVIELKKKLKEKGVRNLIIEEVIAKCKDYGYLNDQSYIEGYIRQQILRKKGPQFIIQKLITKGISKEKAQELLSELDSESTHTDSIKNLLETRYKTKNLSDFRERQKVVLSLLRRGFSLESIQSSIKIRVDEIFSN
jgi:regulatory protein